VSTPTQDQLVRHVLESASVADLETRVAHMHGTEHIAQAKLVAVQLKGTHWVFGELRTPKRSPFPALQATLTIPSNAVLAVTGLALLAALFFPPRVLLLPDGLSIHTGFAFLLGAAESRRLGAVNVSLLAIELATLAAVGAIAFLLARSLEVQRNREK
jgi:hypothetical protein